MMKVLELLSQASEIVKYNPPRVSNPGPTAPAPVGAVSFSMPCRDEARLRKAVG